MSARIGDKKTSKFGDTGTRACHFWVKMEIQTASGKYGCMSHPGTTNI